MNLFRIILICIIIYFVRRFIQMYRTVKRIQEQQQEQFRRNQEAQASQQNIKAEAAKGNVVDADFKVMD